MKHNHTSFRINRFLSRKAREHPELFRQGEFGAQVVEAMTAPAWIVRALRHD